MMWINREVLPNKNDKARYIAKFICKTKKQFALLLNLIAFFSFLFFFDFSVSFVLFYMCSYLFIYLRNTCCTFK